MILEKDDSFSYIRTHNLAFESIRLLEGCEVVRNLVG